MRIWGVLVTWSSDPWPDHPAGFGVILADPPWRYGNTAARGALDYQTLTVREIAELPVGSLCRRDGRGTLLLLWSTGAHLVSGDALRVLRAWGFEPKQVGGWVKVRNGFVGSEEEGLGSEPLGELAERGLSSALRIGSGNYLRNCFEPLILAVRGRVEIRDRSIPSVLFGERAGHSRKPDRLHELAERLAPGPYVELFARRTRPGWATWGNEGAFE